MPNIEVLIDRKSNDLAITLTDDAGNDSETTVTVEEAWALVGELNKAIQALLPSIVAKGSVVQEYVEKEVAKSVSDAFLNAALYGEGTSEPIRVRAAVLESVGADQKRPRHVPPGFPATLKKTGLREYKEPEPVGQ